MSEYGVTKKGFVLKRFDRILSDVQSGASDALGFDVSQNPQSLLNAALIYPFSNLIAELWEEAQNSYYAKYPSSADGINLDNACQYGNILRKAGMPTTYIMHAKVIDGTVIPEGSLISSTTNPVVRLKCAKRTEVSRATFNQVCIRIVVPDSEDLSGTYTLFVNGQAVSYTADSTATVMSIMTGLAVAFDMEEFTAAVSEDKLIIRDSVPSRNNTLTLTSNLTTEYVIGCVSYVTEDYGEIVLPNKSITVITTNVTGLLSIENNIAPKAGRLEETDAELRMDYIMKSFANSATLTDSLESYILDECDGVKAVRCYENDSDDVDLQGRLPHSVEVIVDGGLEEEIGRAILARKAAGINTNGDIVVDVLGKYGDIIPIRFRRPDKVYAWISITLEVGNSNIRLPSDYEKILQDLLTEADMTIGDNWMSQSYIDDIYLALPGITYCTIKVATGTDATTRPAASEFRTGNIIASERQKIVLDTSRIEVVLSS